MQFKTDIKFFLIKYNPIYVSNPSNKSINYKLTKLLIVRYNTRLVLDCFDKYLEIFAI